MKLKGILAGLMGVGFVVAAILIYEEQCEPGELILGAIVMALASGLAAAIVVERISSLYVFVAVAIFGIYVYYAIRHSPNPVSAVVGAVVGAIYGVSLYVGWLRKPEGEQAA